MPPIASIFPAPLFDEAVVVAPLTVPVLLEPVVEVAAADELVEVTAGTLVGMRVAQVLQASEPGLAIRHWAKVAWHMKLGMVPW